MIFRDGERLLEIGGGFDESEDQTRCDMPFDMAVEEPDPGIIGTEAEDDVAVWIYQDGISPHGDGRDGFVVDVRSCVRFTAHNGLEYMAVEMERVFTRIVIVEDYFNDLAFFEDKRICGFAIDGCVGGCDVGGKGSEQSGDFGADVGDVVEEGVVCAIAEIVHRDGEFDGVGRVLEKGHFVDG